MNDSLVIMKALVIEDDRGLQMIAKHALHEYKDAAINVSTARDMKTAWEEFQRVRPHLVLLDITLPDGNGLELIPRMLVAHPHAYIVMMTGSNLAHDVQQARVSGAKDYILKPFNSGKFNDMVAASIAFHKQQGTLLDVSDAVSIIPLIRSKESEGEGERISNGIEAAMEQLHVLFVDDFHANVDNAQRHLSKSGCALDVAHGSKDAWQKMNAKHYHVIFLDSAMPDGSGYILTQQLRQAQSNAAERSFVVGMLETIEERDERQWLHAGMNDYLIKPCRFGDLEKKLRRIAETRIAAPAQHRA